MGVFLCLFFLRIGDTGMQPVPEVTVCVDCHELARRSMKANWQGLASSPFVYEAKKLLSIGPAGYVLGRLVSLLDAHHLVRTQFLIALGDLDHHAILFQLEHIATRPPW